MLKNGQAYFKNTAVETSQDFKSIFGHFSTLYMKVLNYYYFFLGGGGGIQTVFWEERSMCIPTRSEFDYKRPNYSIVGVNWYRKKEHLKEEERYLNGVVARYRLSIWGLTWDICLK